MEAFRQAGVARFEARLEALLAEHCPGRAAAPPEDRRAFVRAAIQRARGWGIWRGDDVVRFLPWLCAYGLDFGATEGTRWAAALLDDGDATGAEKLDRLAAVAPR